MLYISLPQHTSQPNNITDRSVVSVWSFFWVQYCFVFKRLLYKSNRKYKLLKIEEIHAKKRIYSFVLNFVKNKWKKSKINLFCLRLKYKRSQIWSIKQGCIKFAKFNKISCICHQEKLDPQECWLCIWWKQNTIYILHCLVVQGNNHTQFDLVSVIYDCSQTPWTVEGVDGVLFK